MEGSAIWLLDEPQCFPETGPFNLRYNTELAYLEWESRLDIRVA